MDVELNREPVQCCRVDSVSELAADGGFELPRERRIGVRNADSENPQCGLLLEPPKEVGFAFCSVQRRKNRRPRPQPPGHSLTVHPQEDQGDRLTRAIRALAFPQKSASEQLFAEHVLANVAP